LKVGNERIELSISKLMKYPKDTSEEICLLNLEEEEELL